MLIQTCKKSHNFLNWLYAQTPQPCFWISVFLLNIPLLNLMIIKSATSIRFSAALYPQPRRRHSLRSVFDCMIAGSVPVIFWNQTIYGQYEWFLPGEPGSYSVFIDKGEVRNRSSIIKEVLMGYSKEEIRNMREKVIESIPRIIYGIGNEGSTKIFKDAFDIAFDG